MANSSDFYQVLGLPRDAPPEDIRSSYFEAARRLHPDANPDLTAREEFLAIQQAYEVLSNPQKRTNYDLLLTSSQSIPEITINLKYSRKNMLRLTEPQLIYTLFEVVCTEKVDRFQVPPLHICLVLDCSTSMQGDRLDVVKSNASAMVRQLKPQDYLSVVAFKDHAEVVVPPTKAADYVRLEHQISMLHAGGGTEIFQGLSAGVSQLHINFSQDMIRHLILLTDGHTYGDEEACLKLIKQAAQEGISFSALGIGNEWNDGFLDQLAGLGGGSAMLVSSSQDLANLLEQRIRTLSLIYAKGVTISFVTDESVSLKYAFRLYPDVSPLPIYNPIYLGNVPAEKSLIILFEFLVQPITEQQSQVKLMSGRLKMDIPGQVNGKMNFFINLTRDIGKRETAELPPASVVEAMSRLTLYQLQERARSEVAKGNIQAATKHLQHLASHLLSQGSRELAHIILVEAEQIKQQRKFSSGGDKTIKYGTRSFLLPAGMELMNHDTMP